MPGDLDVAILASIFAHLQHSAGLILAFFLKPFSRFHWPYLATSLLFAALAWLIYERRLPPGKRAGFFAFLFPKAVWLHPSAILDYKYVVVDKLMIGILGAAATILAGGAFDSHNEALANTAFDDSLGIVLFYTLSLLLTEDLFRYWTHRLMHRVPMLWEFHKVHHSPQVLVPFSLLRTHPVNGLLNLSRSGAAILLTSGLFLYVFPEDISVLTIFGVNAGRVLFNLLGAHLRHSHVWLGFGPVLSRLFISPAMHQVHHSSAPRHFNRNYGSQFAIWDWVFGTLYIPAAEERGTFEFGLAKSDRTRYRTVRDLYVIPFRQAWGRCKEGRALSWKAPKKPVPVRNS